jgi:hypothetical protein
MGFHIFLVPVLCVMYNGTDIDMKGFERVCCR